MKATQALIASIALSTIMLNVPYASETEPAQSGLREEVNVFLRTVDFLVLDKKGKPVLDLKRDEIELWDEGEKREIVDLLPAHERAGIPPFPEPSSVESESDRSRKATEAHPVEPGSLAKAPPQKARLKPRWVVLLFDANNLSLQSLMRAGSAARLLVEQSLGPDDRVALMIDEDDLRVLVPFTRSREELLEYLQNPEGMTSRTRDIESRLRDLRDDTESCRDVSNLVECAEQATSNFIFEAARETERSLEHFEALLRSLAAIPDRKIVFYFSEGFFANPGDIAAGALEWAIGQFGYHAAATSMRLYRDFSHKLDAIYQIATTSRAGIYAVNTGRKMTDEEFSPERPMEGGPENRPKARTDPFETSWLQARKLHQDLAQATGAQALFKRDPSGHLSKQLDLANGVYSVSYYPQIFGLKNRKLKIKVNRPNVRVLYRNKYNLVADRVRRLSGDLLLSQSEQDLRNHMVRATVDVSGSTLEIVPDVKPPSSLASLFFEIRDGRGELIHDMFEVITYPRGGDGDDKAGRLKRPFAINIKPGMYTLRVDVNDIYGSSKGSYITPFTIDAEYRLVKEDHFRLEDQEAPDAL
jgi:VWFA-related protein